MPELETVHDEITDQSLTALRGLAGDRCEPSAGSISELQMADLVLVSGQIVGGGKSTLIHELESDGRINIPSWTNRDLRSGETEGIDKCKRALSAMADRAVEGYFLELEEIRPGFFYATPAEFTAEQSYVKDLELKGALRLRTFDPELPIVVPLPPIYEVVGKRVTEWERRVIVREGLLAALGDKEAKDLQGRLEGAVEETDRIIELNLLEDPNILVVVNDSLPRTIHAMRTFLGTGEKLDQQGIESHIEKLHYIASSALLAV
ncbi:MAG TPA: hypothetical protein VJC09_01300 [Candidatus Saccharimonadales bacterium]|nr:hypothetical protein [Candidatus Saccharimonadales bacterium]